MPRHSRPNAANPVEISNTNSTVNQFLGGKRKSWMMDGADAPVTTPAASPRRSIRTSPRRANQVEATSNRGAATSTATAAGTLPSPILTDEPSPDTMNQNGRQQVGERPMAYGNTGPPRTELNFSGQQQQSVPGAQRDIGYQPGPQYAGQNQLSINNYVYSQPHPSNAQHNNKRRRITQANSPSLSQYYPILETYMQNCKASGDVFTEQEQARFALLQSACFSNDYFYIAFHQVLCLWIADRQFLKNVIAQPGQNEKILDRGMCFMTQFVIAQKAAPVAAKHGKWFTSFPIEFTHLRNYSDAYRTAVADVATSLILITQHIDTYLAECVHRGYPPTADEVIRIFRVSSPIIQSLIFGWVREQMGIPSDQFAEAMLQEFQQSQNFNAQLSARINTNMPPTQRELEDATNYTKDRYLAIRGEQQAHSMMNGVHPSHAQNVPQPSAPAPAQQPPNHHPSMAGHGYHQGAPTIVTQNNGHGMAAGIHSPAFPSPNTLQYQQAQGQALRRPSSVASHHSGGATMPTQVRSPSISNSPRATPTMQSPAMWQGQFQIPASATQTRQGSFSGPPNHVVPSNAAPNPQFHSQQQHQQRHPSQMTQANHPPPYVNGPRPPVQQVHPPNATIMRPSPAGYSPWPANTASTRRTGSSQPLWADEGDPTPAPHLPNPDNTALITADYRSPTLKPVEQQKGKREGRYYQVVRRCVLGPSVLKDRCVDTFKFGLEDPDIAKLPTSQKLRPTDPDVREVKHGSLMYRARCVKIQGNEKNITEEDFVVADTAWPSHIGIEVSAAGNTVTLSELRRKAHFGKDLPADITSSITRFFAADRKPNITVDVTLSKVEKATRYAFAIEEIEIMRHDIVAQSILDARIDFKTTEDGIKKLLSSSTDDDDDIIMNPADLSIGVQDPWLAKLWKTPVKSVHCLHRECFDLDVWLETRPETRREKSVVHYAQDNGGAFISGIDVWKCPLCGADARPEKLKVDEWMLSVREKLVEQGLAGVARAIVVAPDGSWKMKEEKEVVQKQAVAAEEVAKKEEKEEKKMQKVRKIIDVIDLDSD